MFKYLPINFYRPTKSIKGSMIQLTIKQAKVIQEGERTINTDGFVYLSFASQIAEKKFDYDNKVVLKLNALECGDILRCLSTGGSTELFHRTESRTLSMKVEPHEDRFNLSGNMKDKSGTSKGFFYRLDAKEMEIFKVYLQQAIIEIYRAEV